MDTNLAYKLARETMDRHGLIGWSLEWHHKLRVFGTCNYTRETIYLSKPNTEANDVDELMDTVLHEIAHALTPGAGHGPEWKAMARKLGARPEAQGHTTALQERWKGECPEPDCDFQAGRHRLSARIAARACPACCKSKNGGRFDHRFRLVWTDTKTGEVLRPKVESHC